MHDWNEVLNEIESMQAEFYARSQSAVDLIRRKYLSKLFDYSSRNASAYYSGFLSKSGVAQLDMTDKDKNDFMMAVHKLDRTKGLDLILHTPGGYRCHSINR